MKNEGTSRSRSRLGHGTMKAMGYIALAFALGACMADSPFVHSVKYGADGKLQVEKCYAETVGFHVEPSHCKTESLEAPAKP